MPFGVDPAHLVVVWAVIIAVGVALYVVLDGFDLGIGILFPTAASREEQDVMMNSVAPVWDGNETWLVLGGAGLFGAFPVAYAVLLPALYLPILAMLIALIFRGVAFEFRFKASDRSRPLWNAAFFGGSTLAAFSQGVVLGAFIEGIPTDGSRYAGGTFDWLSPFALFTGLGLVAGYALLGCGWLIWRTTGRLQDRSFRMMLPLAAIVGIAIAGVSLWTPLTNDRIADLWFSWPNILLLSPVPLLVAVVAVMLFLAVKERRELTPFLLCLGLFGLSYAGLGISLWPLAVPPDITLWDAASPWQSQLFLLGGAVILIPVILGYTAYTYWVFRGKVRPGDAYH